MILLFICSVISRFRFDCVYTDFYGKVTQKIHVHVWATLQYGEKKIPNLSLRQQLISNSYIAESNVTSSASSLYSLNLKRALLVNEQSCLSLLKTPCCQQGGLLTS